jgi:hypothetical protein
MKTFGLAVGVAALAASSATAQILYDNGGYLTPNSPNGLCLPAGSGMSEVQPGNTSAGFNTLNTAFHEADDFIVPAGETWNVTGFRFAMYQTGATTSTVNTLYIQIWNGQPGTAGASVIAGNLTTNRLVAPVALTNDYRYFTATCATNRRVQDVRGTLAASLPAGTYWVQWATIGNAAFSGPWNVPVTIEGLTVTPGANGIFLTVGTGVWAPTLDVANPQDMQFIVEGSEGGCYPDCNGDSALTVADFGCFQTRFVAADPYADCNGDSALTVADFGCFQTKFVAGCP